MVLHVPWIVWSYVSNPSENETAQNCYYNCNLSNLINNETLTILKEYISYMEWKLFIAVFAEL